MKIKLLSDKAKIPTRGSEYAAGLDLYAATGAIILPHTTEKISTDIAIKIPKGYFGGIFARSGLATKEGLRLANSVAVIDEDYRGPIIVALHNDSDKTRFISAYDRIAQLVFIPYSSWDWEIVDELSDTERNTSGFGSTGQ